MTVALVLAAEADAGMCGQLAALGVRRVDLAGAGRGRDYGSGLLTVAAAARVAGERVLICVGEGAIPGDVLARLLGAGGTAAFSGRGAQVGTGALVADTPDLLALADAAEWLAASPEADDPLGALLGELARRGVRTRVLDAGPDGGGMLAQAVADPAARHLARWALARDLEPATLSGISLGLGLVAAVWFSAPTLGARDIGIAALAGAFVSGRAGGLVAASGRWTGPAMDWLGTAISLVTELAVYGALAFSVASAAHGGDAYPGLNGLWGNTLRHTFAATWGGGGSLGVWRLAMAAMGLLGIRRLAELCYDHAADNQRLHREVMRRIEQAITLPAGERYAVIAFTAVLFGPRVTFLALLGLGALAILYVLAGRALGSAVMAVMLPIRGNAPPWPPATRVGDPPEPPASHGAPPPDTPWGIADLPAYRNDGQLSRWIGGVVQGRLPPLLPVLVGLMVASTLSALGLANLPGILVLTPVEGMLLAALGSWHPHDGRRDWLVPPLLLGGEFVFLAALGLSRDVAPMAVFALLGAVVLRHVDVGFRARHGSGISADVLGLGWDGRMLLLGLAALAGQAPLAYIAFSGYLWVLFAWDFLGGWLLETEVEQALASPRRLARVIGMVLAAGAGRRLRPDTDGLPKALLPVDGDVTILDIALRNLAAVGLKDIVIVVGYAADVVHSRKAALAKQHDVTLTLVDNDRAEDWNNAYSLWLARDHFTSGVLLVNGDTVHPASVERTLLSQQTAPGIVLAIDDSKPLADEEMKVTLTAEGTLARITKNMDPARAYGEYIGATLIQPAAGTMLARALEATWRRDPSLYYEDGFQEYADRGGAVGIAPIGAVDWVEVDNHDDLRRAREIATRC